MPLSRELLRRMDMQEGDPIPQRFHWPRMAALRLNGLAYDLYPRRGDIKLGNNGRDTPADCGKPPYFPKPYSLCLTTLCE
jgi:hypothetical protein